MRIFLTIDTSNEAFNPEGGQAGDMQAGLEVGRILLKLGQEYVGSGVRRLCEDTLRDINGNTCGKVLHVTDSEIEKHLANAVFVQSHGARIPMHIAEFALKLMEVKAT